MIHILSIVIVVAIWWACYLTQRDTIKEEYGELERSEFLGEIISGSHFIWIAASAIVIWGVAFAATASFAGTFFAIIAYAMIAGAYIALCIWWHQVGSSWLEMLPFAVIAACLGFIMNNVSWAIKSDSVMLLAFCHGLPAALCLATIGFFVVDKFYFDYREINKGGIKRVVFAGILTVIVALVGMVFAANNNDFVDEATDTEEITAEETTTKEPVDAETAAADTAEDDNSEFAQNWTKNENHRIDSEFAEKLKKSAKDGVITGETAKAVILNNCAHDARNLAFWASNFKLWDDPNDHDALLTSDKKYLSEEGKKLYYKLEGSMAVMAAEREEAPANGTNTGYDDGFVVAESAGIDGDRTGTKFSTPSGEEKFWVMDRCANIVYKNPPRNIPKGGTDNPKPKPTPTKPKPTPTKPKPKPTPTPTKNPAADPVNNGNANKGGGQNKPSDGAGQAQPQDPRTQKPTGTNNNNNQGHSDPGTVKPATPKSSTPANNNPSKNVVHENKMDYNPDPVTNRGPVDTTKPPTKSEGDGEFTPAD